MLRHDRDFSTLDAGMTEAYGANFGTNKAEDTCGKTTVKGTMNRGFTVYDNSSVRLKST